MVVQTAGLHEEVTQDGYLRERRESTCKASTRLRAFGEVLSRWRGGLQKL